MTAEYATWRATVLTLFPEMFPGLLGHSLAGKALKDGLWALEACSIRDWAADKHATVDDTPFGGGPGMVIRADVVDAALCAVAGELADAIAPPVVYLTPRGRPLIQERVAALAGGPGVILVCGRYEGIDERVVEAWNMEEVSIGDFVLSGGEPAAMALIDATVRLLPGVIGSEESYREESFQGGLLEYPHYTKPRVWQDREVPGVLLSGHHGKVDAWRKAEAEKATEERRPDLWHRYAAKNF